MLPASLLSRLFVYSIGQLPCTWLVHFKAGRFWMMLRKRKAYTLHVACVCECMFWDECFVGNICILGSRSSLCFYNWQAS